MLRELQTRVGRIGMLALVAILVAGMAGAQTTGAELRGIVSDESGGVLPGVTVTVVHKETGTQSTAYTNEQGQFRIPALRPGGYEVKAELTGFSTAVRPEIDLVIGQVLDVSMPMKLGSLEETITVASDAPLVETSKSGVSTVVTREQVAALPILGRAWQELALLAPGAAAPTGSRGSFSVGGTSGRNPSVQVDGADMNDNGTGSAGLQISQDAIREFNVQTSRFNAEFGRSQSSAVSVVTKSGGNALFGSLFGFFRNEQLNADDFFTAVKKPFKFNQAGGSIGGPIRRDKTFFFFNFERRSTSQFSSSNTGYAALDLPHEAKNTVKMAFGRINHTFNNAHQAFVRAAWSDGTSTGVGNGKSSWETAAGRHQLGHSVVVAENWVIRSNMVNEFRAQTNKWFTGTLLNFEGPEYNFPSVIYGTNYRNPQGRREKRLEIRNDLSITYGDHALKVGVDTFPQASWGFYLYQNFYGRYFFRTDPANILDQSTWPQPYQYRLGVGDFEEGGDVSVFNAYAQDDWRVGDRLTLNLGIRYDIAPGAASEDFTIPGNKYYPSYGTDSNNWGPRGGATFLVGGDRQIVLRGGVGLYQNMFLWNQGIYKMLFNNVTTFTVDVRNPTLADPLGGKTIDQLRAAQVPGEIQAPDPAIDTPHSLQASGGMNMELPGSMALSADFVWLHGKNQYRWRDINLFEDCQNIAGGCARPDPAYTRILQYQARVESRYKALLLGLTRRFNNRVGFQVSYTLANARNEADDSSSIADEPSNMFIPGVDWGPALNDARHLLVTSSTMALPYDFRFSTIIAARTGLPHKTLAGSDVNGDGSSVEDRPAGWTRNSLRTNASAKVDVRFSRTFAVGGPARVEAMFEVYNLFNRENYDPTTYGTTITAKNFHVPGPSTDKNYQPRQGQVALRLTF